MFHNINCAASLSFRTGTIVFYGDEILFQLSIGRNHVKIFTHFYNLQAKFQQDIIKRKQLESENSSAFKENNLLVEDGDDMWDVLSQIPDNIGKF